MPELLFSYGTLQSPEVQLELFGRLLRGFPDVLTGYKVESIEIKDEAFLESGEDRWQKIATPSTNAADSIKGVLLEVSEEELKQADQYEPPDYKRICVKFVSGKSGWIYAAVDS